MIVKRVNVLHIFGRFYHRGLVPTFDIMLRQHVTVLWGIIYKILIKYLTGTNMADKVNIRSVLIQTHHYNKATKMLKEMKKSIDTNTYASVQFWYILAAAEVWDLHHQSLK